SLRGRRGCFATLAPSRPAAAVPAPRETPATVPKGVASMFTHSVLDWALIAFYFASLASVWVRALGRRPSAVDYVVAGRRVTLPAFVATLVASFYGGILGVGEFTWRYGIANWLVFGVPYYLGAALFAGFLAK